MEREILFKAKKKDNNEWVYGYIVIDKVNHSDNETGEDIYYIAGNSDVYVEVIPSTIGQYTGLTDKNGKKIFENDLIKYFNECKYSYEKGYVKYSKKYSRFDIGWMAEIKTYKNNGFIGSQSPMGTSKDYEVIGNIFDNEEKL